MEKNWIKIFASGNLIQAEIIKQALVGNGIDAVLLNKQDTAYGIFGQAEVYIHEQDFGHATEMMIQSKLGESF